MFQLRKKLKAAPFWGPPSDLVRGRQTPDPQLTISYSATKMKIQLPTPPNSAQIGIIEAAIHEARLARYLPAAEGSKAFAFQIYLWNMALCEAFHISLHFCEICTRNSIHKAVISKFGRRWFHNPKFKSILSDRFVVELEKAIEDEARQHRENLTENHIASALTFGFWEHLTTKRFSTELWKYGIRSSFPGAPTGETLEDLRALLIKIRQWRNRIAHHRAIFDHGPTRKHKEALELIVWSCPTTAEWVKKSSQVPKVVNLRPKEPTQPQP